MTGEVKETHATATTGKSEPRSGKLWLILVAAIFASMFALYYYPSLMIGPLQPIPFSHRVHAGVKEINCRFCHPNVDRSANAGLPSLEKCFFCHKYIIRDHEEIKAVERHLSTDTPVSWVRIFWVPDFTFFDHIPHVKLAKLECSDCHGNVKSEDRLERVYFKMEFCITCHRKKNAQLDCWLACHR
jgi:hypothetical protein